jgi:putative membrane protein
MSFAETVINTFLDRKLSQPATPAPVYHPDDRSLAKGILAGVIAGLAATAAKTVVEKVYPPRAPADAKPGTELALAKQVPVEPIHWASGAAIGAAYGALAEYYPAASAHEGVNFGMTVMALTHETALPAMGIAAAPASQSRREKSSEIASHIIFGLVAETTRRLVRKMI